MTPRAQKKAPRTWQERGGDGGEPNKKTVPQAPRKSKWIHIAAPLFEGAAIGFFFPAAAYITFHLVGVLR